MPYVNRTVKHPSSLYELGIFTPKYVNRTVQEAIYCMICVLTSRAQKKAGIRSGSRPSGNVYYYFNDSGDSNPSSPQKKLMHLSAASKSPMLSILMTTSSLMNVPTATQPLADS